MEPSNLYNSNRHFVWGVFIPYWHMYWLRGYGSLLQTGCFWTSLQQCFCYNWNSEAVYFPSYPWVLPLHIDLKSVEKSVLCFATVTVKTYLQPRHTRTDRACQIPFYTVHLVWSRDWTSHTSVFSAVLFSEPRSPQAKRDVLTVAVGQILCHVSASFSDGGNCLWHHRAPSLGNGTSGEWASEEGRSDPKRS